MAQESLPGPCILDHSSPIIPGLPLYPPTLTSQADHRENIRTCPVLYASLPSAHNIGVTEKANCGQHCVESLTYTDTLIHTEIPYCPHYADRGNDWWGDYSWTEARQIGIYTGCALLLTIRPVVLKVKHPQEDMFTDR